MLHGHNRIPRTLQPPNGGDDLFRIARVQAGGGFVEHVKRVDQAGTQSTGQHDSLSFSAGKRFHTAVQRQIREAAVRKKRQSSLRVFHRGTQRRL